MPCSDIILIEAVILHKKFVDGGLRMSNVQRLRAWGGKSTRVLVPSDETVRS